jgi:hypothetical protein
MHIVKISLERNVKAAFIGMVRMAKKLSYSPQTLVFVNATLDQAEMSATVKSLASLASLPGVPDDCRTAGLTLNCGNFPMCVTLPRTNGNQKTR